MQVWSRSESVVSGVGAIVVAIVSAVLLLNLKLPAVPAACVAAPAAILFYCLNMIRYLRRRRWAKEPFPESWSAVLERRVPFYRHLHQADDRRAFEQQVFIFLKETRITGIETIITDEVRLLIGASAVMLLFRRPQWEYRSLPEVLVYPRSFDDEYAFDVSVKHRTLSGKVVPRQAILLAKDQLLRSFSGEPYNVAIHEFAHVLDMVEGVAAGIPGLVDSRKIRQWRKLIHKELKKVREADSILDPYAGKNAAELFAVAVEHFFGRPHELRQAHPQLYAAIASFFNQDPAAEGQTP